MVGTLSISQAKANATPRLRHGGLKRYLGTGPEDVECSLETLLTHARFSSVVPDPVHVLSLALRLSHALWLPIGLCHVKQ